MISNFENIKKLVYKFENYGVFNIKATDAILIGRPEHISPKGCLNCLFKPLTEKQTLSLEKDLKTSIPKSYRDFLINFSNGLDILNGTLSLYGQRNNFNRNEDDCWQPYSLLTPNLSERPKNAPSNLFFIGTYNWDGSNVYIDKNTEEVHFCARYDATSLFKWDSLENMLLSEISRIYTYFTDDGKEIDESISTLPV